LAAHATCSATIKFCPTSTGSKGATLQIPLADAETPVLTALLHNHESTGEEARRRLPAVIYSLNIPENMISGQTYTLTWSQLGYDDSYQSIIAFFNCAGINDGSCGDTYGSNFNASAYIEPDSVQAGDWTYNGVQSQKFNYSYSFTAPVVTSGTDIVIRFYSRSQTDADSGNGGLSTLIPGNLSGIYYEQAGRRILKRITAP
jgi:hypothetical protein